MKKFTTTTTTTLSWLVGMMMMMVVVIKGDAEKCSESNIACLCDTKDTERFEQGKDKSDICLRFDGVDEVSSGTERNLYFITTTVDEFTLVSLAGSNLASHNWTEEVKLRVELGGYVSEERYIKKGAYVITQLTLVVVVDSGKIKDIVWDDSCNACSDTACQDGNCGTGLNYCRAQSNKNYCDLKIYWSWYGTDKHGNYMLSASERISRYQSYSAKSYYGDVTNQMADIDSQYNGYRDTGKEQQ